MVKLDQVSVGDIVRTLYDDGDSPWCISHANQRARVLDVRPSRGDRPVLVEYLYWPCAGDLHWLYLDQFEILNKQGGVKLNKATDLKVGDKVRIADVNVGFDAIDDNLGKVVEVVAVDQGDPKFPIKVKYLSGDWKGCKQWLHKDYFHRIIPGESGAVDHSIISAGDVVRIVYGDYGNEMMVDNDGKLAKVVEVDEGALIMPVRVEFLQGKYKGRKCRIENWMYELIEEEEVEVIEVVKIKEGDFVVIDTTHSEDSLLEGLHGKVVRVVEVDPTDTALPIEVVLPNGYNRWMYPEEFYTAPTEGFNILVDEDKYKLYGDAAGKEVPVLEADYECVFGYCFEAMHNGELIWVSYKDCKVVQDTDVAPELPKEAVEFDFTVLKSHTNGAVNTFLRIDKQSKHFYDKDLLAEFNKAQASYLVCRSAAVPEFLEGYKKLYLRGIEDSADAIEIPIPDDCLEQVVTTLVDLKAWMLNRCKQ